MTPISTLRRRPLLATTSLAALPSWALARPLKIFGVELPPLIVPTGHGASGVICEITQRAARRAGLAAEIEVVPWARGLAALKSGDCDALIPTIRSAEREAQFDFPVEPVYRSGMSFFGRADAMPPFTGKLAELAGRSFVKLRGALFAPDFDEALRQGRIRCEEVASFAAAIRMVDAGRVDFAAVPRLVGLQLIASEGLTGRLAPLEPPFFVQSFFLAFARKPALTEARQRIDEHLARMWRDGSVQAVEDEYRRRQWLPPSAASAPKAT